VEIDERVIEVTRKFFKFCDDLEDYIKKGRLEIIIEDGAKYLKEKADQNKLFDGIIIDNSDVFIFEGPAASLFTKEFYQNIHKVLKENASFSQQVSTEVIKNKWESIVKSAGLFEVSYLYCDTPEYSTSLPLGRAKKKIK